MQPVVLDVLDDVFAQFQWNIFVDNSVSYTMHIKKRYMTKLTSTSIQPIVYKNRLTSCGLKYSSSRWAISCINGFTSSSQPSLTPGMSMFVPYPRLTLRSQITFLSTFARFHQNAQHYVFYLWYCNTSPMSHVNQITHFQNKITN